MYKFNEDDLKFVQNLFPDTVKVCLRENSLVMYADFYSNNKYIDYISGYFNKDFFRLIEDYFSKEGKVQWNNTRSSWWVLNDISDILPCDSNKK